nr:MAG TPA: hypothetical protein [Caudoviricetes sp.]
MRSCSLRSKERMERYGKSNMGAVSLLVSDIINDHI